MYHRQYRRSQKRLRVRGINVLEMVFLFRQCCHLPQGGSSFRARLDFCSFRLYFFFPRRLLTWNLSKSEKERMRRKDSITKKKYHQGLLMRWCVVVVVVVVALSLIKSLMNRKLPNVFSTQTYFGTRGLLNNFSGLDEGRDGCSNENIGGGVKEGMNK